MSKVNIDTRILGSKHPKQVKIPNSNQIPRLSYGRTLLEMKKTNRWVAYFGYGVVMSIAKCEDFDLVTVDFGTGVNSLCKVYFRTLNSRKQVYTLKVGQFALFGMIQNIQAALKEKKLYYALWCMGIYVPKAIDIKTNPLKEEEITELTEEEYGEGLTFLDTLKKND